MLTLVPATESDAAILFVWRNDPDTRANSHTVEPVSFESHLTWLSAVLANPDRRLLIAKDGDCAIGTVRLDRDGDTAELSLTVAPEYRGRGYARRLVEAAIDHLPSVFPTVTLLCASIKQANERSLRAFAACRFRPVRSEPNGVVWVERPTVITNY